MSEDLEERLVTMKREIDALQIASAAKARPWYRDFSTLLSVTALLFSFGTTFVSYHRTEMQDIQSARQELRGLLQRIAALPKENLDAAKKYADDPASRSMVSGFINQENTLLARNCAELAKKLPAGSVSATEFYAIAVALQNAYDLAGADEFLNYAIKADPDFNTEISCLRMLASMKFISGKPETGRVEYQKALDIFSKYPQFDPYTRAVTNVQTELAWAFSEASSNVFNLASQHVENAEALVASFPRSPGVDMMRSQISQARSQIYVPPALPAAPSLLPGSQMALPTSPAPGR